MLLLSSSWIAGCQPSGSSTPTPEPPAAESQASPPQEPAARPSRPSEPSGEQHLGASAAAPSAASRETIDAYLEAIEQAPAATTVALPGPFESIEAACRALYSGEPRDYDPAIDCRIDAWAPEHLEHFAGATDARVVTTAGPSFRDGFLMTQRADGWYVAYAAYLEDDPHAKVSQRIEALKTSQQTTDDGATAMVVELTLATKEPGTKPSHNTVSFVCGVGPSARPSCTRTEEGPIDVGVLIFP